MLTVIGRWSDIRYCGRLLTSNENSVGWLVRARSIQADEAGWVGVGSCSAFNTVSDDDDIKVANCRPRRWLLLLLTSHNSCEEFMSPIINSGGDEVDIARER